MNKLGKREGIAVAVALVAAGIVLFGGDVWNFFVGGASTGDGPTSQPSSSTLPTSNPQAMNNISTVPGIEIYDETEGTGAVATPGKTLTVHYVGVFQNGQKFDSSIDRGQPFQFNLGAGMVIQGWDKGMEGMKVGGTRRLVVSPEMGYGPNDYGPIPGGSTLIFQVQLLNVE